MEVTPLSGALGAVIKKVDLNMADDESLGRVKSALDHYLVLYFPDQQLDRFQLSRIGAFFGPPFIHPIVNNGFADCPQVLELIREPEHTAMFGGESWHSDVSWLNPSAYVSILHSIEVPKLGGDTAFASTQQAFDALSNGMKSLLRNLSAVHSYYWNEGLENPDYTVRHPVVRCHPVTKREGIFVNPMFTSRFSDMSVEESRPLLKYLFDHLIHHPFTCRFRWAREAVIIWDNRFTLHYPINDFSGQRRQMIRTTAMDF